MMIVDPTCQAKWNTKKTEFADLANELGDNVNIS